MLSVHSEHSVKLEPVGGGLVRVVTPSTIHYLDPRRGKGQHQVLWPPSGR